MDGHILERASRSAHRHGHQNRTAAPPRRVSAILNVDQSKSVIVLKRSMNSGFAGIDNPLFYADGTTMLFGDAKTSVTEVAEDLKAL